jgi:hypothetical protein
MRERARQPFTLLPGRPTALPGSHLVRYSLPVLSLLATVGPLPLPSRACGLELGLTAGRAGAVLRCGVGRVERLATAWSRAHLGREPAPLALDRVTGGLFGALALISEQEAQAGELGFIGDAALVGAFGHWKLASTFAQVSGTLLWILVRSALSAQTVSNGRDSDNPVRGPQPPGGQDPAGDA